MQNKSYSIIEDSREQMIFEEEDEVESEQNISERKPFSRPIIVTDRELSNSSES